METRLVQDSLPIHFFRALQTGRPSSVMGVVHYSIIALNATVESKVVHSRICIAVRARIAELSSDTRHPSVLRVNVRFLSLLCNSFCRPCRRTVAPRALTASGDARLEHGSRVQLRQLCSAGVPGLNRYSARSRPTRPPIKRGTILIKFTALRTNICVRSSK